MQTPHLKAPLKREEQESNTHIWLYGCSIDLSCSCLLPALHWELSNQRPLSVTTLCSAPPALTETPGCGGGGSRWLHSPSGTLRGWASCWSGNWADPNIIVGIPAEPRSALWHQWAKAGLQGCRTKCTPATNRSMAKWALATLLL